MNKDLDLLIDTCLLAGKIMAENGSEGYRVEEIMNRIAFNYGKINCVSYVTSTGVFICFKENNFSKFDQIEKRTIDLEKVNAVNGLSRTFEQNTITLEMLQKELMDINVGIPTFSVGTKIWCSGFVSACLMITLGGGLFNFPVTFLIGMIGFSVSIYIKNKLKVDFINELVASFLIGILALVSFNIGISTNSDDIIIGSIMPLVPGLSITIAFRDIIVGHYLNGIGRAIEAFLILSSIGIGIALALTFVN